MKYQVVSTKLSPESYRLLFQLCARQGLTIYEFLQMVCDTLIRYMDDRHNMTPEMEKAMSVFDHMVGWKTATNLCDPQSNAEVHEATYFYSEEGKTGSRAVHVEMPFMGENIATMNIQDIIERTLCLIVPDRYKRLRKCAIEHGTTSLLSYIDQLLNRVESEDDLREIRRGFEDNRRSKYGKEDLEQRFKQKKARGMDNAADRKRILGEDLWDEIESGRTTNYDDDDAQQDLCEADELSAMAEDEDGPAD